LIIDDKFARLLKSVHCLLKKEFLLTGDGSYTIYLPEMEETYHSRNGAIAESDHVFIRNGLSLFAAKPEIRVLEIGWGTGLNSLLAWFWALENNRKLEYLALEPNPLSNLEWQSLNYGQCINNGYAEEFFLRVHRLPWEENHQLHQLFAFKKTKTEIEKSELPNESVDLIFYDAFAPKKQPEMWRREIFVNCYQWLSKGGILTSYCANGQFKRDLKSVGFSVENPKGPFGKREMTVAYKN